MKNLKLFTGKLLVETASLFPELRVIKYLPSKKAVQKEWQGEFDTPTRKLLKELWELVNNKTGIYSVLFSERLESNRKDSKNFTLELFVSNFLISSKRLGSEGDSMYKYILSDNDDKKHEFPKEYVSSKKCIYLHSNSFFSTNSTGLNCMMGEYDEGMMLIFNYEFENYTAGKKSDELYSDLFSQIRVIDVLSNNSNKYTFFDKITYFKKEDRDDNAYLQFIVYVDFKLDITSDVVFKELKIELKKIGIEFGFLNKKERSNDYHYFFSIF